MEKHSIQKSLFNLAIALLIFTGIFIFAFRTCTQGYDKYVIYIQASDISIFSDELAVSDARIVDRGRKLKDEVIEMDKEIDHGDGPDSGRLRWYVCGGIDCEEGWEREFLPVYRRSSDG
jgi:hypothetical protein